MRASLIVLAFAVLGSTGCHMALAGLILGAKNANPPYEAGALAGDLGPGAVRTLACLDVGLAISGIGNDALLDMHVGNHCVHAEPFDFERLVLRGTGFAGEVQPVRLRDPRHEIVRIHVGALERGHERIRISDLERISQICFELDAVAPDAPDARPLPLCLDRHLDGWSPRSL